MELYPLNFTDSEISNVEEFTNNKNILYKLFPKDVLNIIINYLYKKEYHQDALNYFMGYWNKIKEPQKLGSSINALDIFKYNTKEIGSYDETYEFSYHNIGCYQLENKPQSILGFEIDKKFENPIFLEEVLLIAVRNNSVNICEIIVSNYTFKKSKITLSKRDDISSNTQNDVILKKALQVASENNFFDCIKIILKKYNNFDSDIISSAVKSGSIELLEFYKKCHFKEIFPWYSDNINEGKNPDIILSACSSGHLHIIEYLTDNIFECINSTTQINPIFSEYHNSMVEKKFDEFISVAGSNGHQNIIDYLLNIDSSYPKNDFVLEEILKSGKINTFYYLHNRKTTPLNSPDLLLSAVMANNLEVFKYLRNPNTGKGEVGYEANQNNNTDIMIIQYWGPPPIHTVRADIAKDIFKNKRVEFIKYFLENEEITFNKNQVLIIPNKEILELMYNNPKYVILINSNLSEIFYNSCIDNNQEKIDWFIQYKMEDLKEINNEIFKFEEKYKYISEVLIENYNFEKVILLLTNDIITKPRKEFFLDHLKNRKIQNFVKNTFPDIFEELKEINYIPDSKILFKFGEKTSHNLYTDLPEDLIIKS